MRKCIIAILLCTAAFVLCACSRQVDIPAEEPVLDVVTLPKAEAVNDPLHLTADTFPQVYGSDSLQQLGWAVYSSLTGERWENARDHSTFGASQTAFLDLLEGKTTLAMTMQIPQEFRDSIYWVYSLVYEEVIAKESLIFVVDSDNPIESLTVDQLRRIYSGEVTNWMQIGGNDVPVTAYHYGDNSGAQILLEQQVMQGKQLIPAQTVIGFPIILEGIYAGYNSKAREMIVSYEKGAGAIGFTLGHNMDAVLNADDLKILRVDNVYPDKSAVADGSYPLIGNYCAYITQLTEKDSPEELLFHWLVSKEGQQLIADLGYIPAAASAESSQLWHTAVSGADFPSLPKQSFSTDISQLPDKLVASNQYGRLRVYFGSTYHTTDEKGNSFSDLPRYGFFDGSGEPVTKPIYTHIYELSCEDAVVFAMEYAADDGTARWQAASADGSKITGEYLNVRTINGYLAGIRDAAGKTYDLLDADLNICGNEQTTLDDSTSESNQTDQPTEEGWLYLDGDVFEGTIDGCSALWNRSTGHKLLIPDFNIWSLTVNIASHWVEPIFMVELTNQRRLIVKGNNLEWSYPEVQGNYFTWHIGVDGDAVLYTGSGGVGTLYADDCKTTIAQWMGGAIFYHDSIVINAPDGCLCLDYRGNVLFSYPTGGMNTGD